MKQKEVFLDWFNIFVITLTFTLFALALFIKGFVHDLLLEAGVLLVSVKLIISTYKITKSSERIEKKLDQILSKRE